MVATKGKRKNKVKNNLVAKHMHKVNRPSVERDLKKYYRKDKRWENESD